MKTRFQVTEILKVAVFRKGIRALTGLSNCRAYEETYKGFFLSPVAQTDSMTVRHAEPLVKSPWSGGSARIS